MKLLILGGNGMAGHMLVQYFRMRGEHSIFYTSRDTGDSESLLLDLAETGQVDSLLAAVRPHIIINASGILNEACEKRPIEAFQVNATLPHRLQQRADAMGAKVIHISTDCVFLGTRGRYAESDAPDGTTMYAKTKASGELYNAPHLTIRTSIVGPEIRKQGIGLLNWFLQQSGHIYGYRHVYWNGVTTLMLAKLLHDWLDASYSGIVHLAHPQPLSKYELLCQFQQAFDKQDVIIQEAWEPTCDRTLVHTRADVQYELPSYEIMLRELVDWMGATS